MGLDWRYLSLSAYLEALEASNEMHDPEAGKRLREIEPDSRMKRFMKAHALN